MIEAGLAKVFHPGAAVRHSHDSGPVTTFRRCFDEWRGLHEVYGHVESAAPKRIMRTIFDETSADVAFLRDSGVTHEVVRFDGGHEWTSEFRAAAGRWLEGLSG